VPPPASRAEGIKAHVAGADLTPVTTTSGRARRLRAAVLVVVAALAGCTVPDGPPPTQAPSAAAPSTSDVSASTGPPDGTATAAPTTLVPTTAVPNVEPAAVAGPALVALSTLPVKGRAPRTGYDRELFGQRWADTDRNGCDTRNDVLRRDLVDVVLDPRTSGCVVLTGTLPDPFSGQDLPFVRGPSSAEVQIDHVVALSDAWQKGAQQWTPARRLAFANDPLNLLAVQGSLNAQKSDGDAATWLPPHKPSRCAYVARQVAVKVKYGAWVTRAEHDALARELGRCPAQPLPGSDHPVESDLGSATGRRSPAGSASPSATAAPATPAPGTALPVAPGAPAAGCDPAYPDVCIPPAAGGDLDCPDVTARDIRVLPPDPHRFDADGDGVGCVSG
jgi:hypothetical protein